MTYVKNKEGYIINKKDRSLVIDMLSHKPIHINNAIIKHKVVFDAYYLFEKLSVVINYVDDTQRKILCDIFLNNIINSSPSDIISKIIIEIMKILEIPLQTQNMLLSLVPDHCDILLKILSKLDCYDYEDIDFLFNNYNYLLKNNIELIQNKFSLYNDIIIEIRKVLIEQAVKEDYKTLLFIPEHEITDDIIKLAIKCDYRAISNLSNDKLTDDFIKFAVQNNGFAFLYVPEDKITEEIIKLAIKTEFIKKEFIFSDMFEYIPEDKITDEIIKLAINESKCDSSIFSYIPKDKITDEIIKLALKKEFIFSEMFDYIPEDKITDEIIELANMYGYGYFLDD
jgi:hypothetical protein